MELNNVTVHAFVTLLLVLAAAVVAFFCDLQNGALGRLREQLAALRGLEGATPAGLMAAPAMAGRSVAMASGPVEVPAATASVPVAEVPKREAGRQVEPARKETSPERQEMIARAQLRASQMASRGASQEALERGAAMASASGHIHGQGRRAPKRELTWATPDELQAFALGGPRRPVAREEHHSETLPVHAAQPVAGSPVPEQAASAASAQLARQHEPVLTPVEEPRAERSLVVVHRSPAAEASRQSGSESAARGIGDRAALARLKRGTDRFTGTVTVISAENFRVASEHLGKGAAEETMRQASRIIENLAGERDMLCRNAEDEFVLVSPDTAATSKRRLDQLAERLWDFQLRNLGTSSISFSWGSAQANQELFADVLAEAQSRMEDGRRRARKAPGLVPQKIAVNG
jgi:GGDEF domain-containing protein